MEGETQASLMIGFIQPGNYILHEHFVAFWARINARHTSNRNELFRSIARTRFPLQFYPNSFFIFFFSLSRFFFTSILFKYLKLNEFALSKWQQKADTGFIIPFLSVLFDDSFSICFLRIRKRVFKRLG